MRPFLRLENEQKSCTIWVYSFLEIALIPRELRVSSACNCFSKITLGLIHYTQTPSLKLVAQSLLQMISDNIILINNFNTER